ADAAALLPVNSVLHPLDGLVEQPGPRSAGRAALIRLAIYDPWPLPNDEDANCSRRQSRMLSDLFRCLTSVLLLGSCLSFSYLVGCGLNRTATTSVRLCATVVVALWSLVVLFSLLGAARAFRVQFAVPLWVGLA